MTLENITNLNTYNAGMKKSLLDKIFFMDKIDSPFFLDYGCADGILVNFLYSLFPEFEYFGFDISSEMIHIARVNNKILSDNFFFNWDELEIKLKEKDIYNTGSILLSSIIHEAYSYGTTVDVENFWDRIFNRNWKYIIIRDMIPSITIDRISDVNDVSKLYKKSDRKLLHDFEKMWGNIESNRNLIHFLLKYRYSDNWSREVKENYIPVFREELLANIPDNYRIIFHEHFILPHLKNVVKKDFGIDLKDATHLKLILERED